MSAKGTTWKGPGRSNAVTWKRLASGQSYGDSAYSKLANEAARAAWDKLSSIERAELQEHINRIVAAQDAVNAGKEHHTPTIANGGVELLAKLGMFLNNTDYVRMILDAQ